MLVGHFAAGLAAKRIAPRISLGTLVVAAMLPDFVWCVLLTAGVEHVYFAPGERLLDSYQGDVPYSHSLATTAVWGAVLAGVYFLRRGYQREAWVIFAASVSHWLLDFASHPPDMALFPGGSLFGLGLWKSLPATLAVEGGIWIAALVWYVRGTRAGKRAGIYAFWPVIVLLTLAWINNIAGPAPPNANLMGISSFLFFSLAAAWAYWMNRARPMEQESDSV